MRRTPLTAALALGYFLCVPAAGQAQRAISQEHLAAFQPRVIGPAVTGGRVHDVEALPDDPSTLYVATASGGLWKSVNRGHTWTDLWTDMPTSTFGDVAIAPSDPNVVYAGTGEQNNRQSTSWGNGVYRSDDGGETWTHLGLEDTRHIGEVRVDPRNADVVWVAALGNLWADSEERGVYKSSDGGRTWDKSLFVDPHTGAVDLVLDPANPDVAYAAMYQRQRRTWGFNGGGPGSGIYRTQDGGATWTELSEGLPEGDKGRIGLAIAASNPQVLNALVEHGSESGTYRSENGGNSWERVSTRNPRPMYYSHIYIDPTDEDVVYSLATQSAVSRDGGQTWESISAQTTYDVGMHADKHSMWIDPSDPEHFYLAGDAGLHETYDGGVSYRKINNFPIGQFYAIGVDNRDPYWVYGGMQDNHSWMGPSETRHWIGILNDDWKQIGFGDGMYQQVDPSNPRYAYVNSNGGGYTRVDTETGDILDVRPREPEGEDYRWDWASPSLVSRHDPATVYVGGNRLFTSHNRGESWTPSEDLTRQIDRDQLEIMGVLGAEFEISPNDGTSSYGEITTLGESPGDADVLWVGTDDGNVQVSRDGGLNWTEVGRNLSASAGAPDGTYVSRVLPSEGGAGVAYVTLDAHRDGDFAAYVYRTEDFGATWTALHAGLPSGSVNVIVEHPGAPNTLYLGTEHALFVSTDRGAQWARLSSLPTTHIDDLVVHPREKDLVIGTHGRSIWIVDNVEALGDFGAASGTGAELYSIGRGTIHSYWKDTSYRAQAEFHGQNPRDGVEVTYELGPGGGEATLVVRNARNEQVRTLSVPSGAGVHRINWDLRRDLAPGGEAWTASDPEFPRPMERRGPFISPGVYSVTLQARGGQATQMVEVRGDPALDLTDTQYRARERFLVDLLALEQRLRTQAGAPEGEGCSGLSGAPAQTCRAVSGLYGSINGQGIRPGSMYGPTAAQRAQFREIQSRVEELITG